MLTRRDFSLSLCALPLAPRAAAAPRGPWDGPATLAKVYLAGTTVHWPTPTLDLEREKARIDAALAEVETKHAGALRFSGGALLRRDEDVEPFLKQVGGVDGLLIVPIAQPVGPLRPLVAASRLPMLFFAVPYASHAWSGIGAMQREGARIAAVASSSFGDLDPYVPVFRAIHHLRNSKVLVAAQSPRGRQETADAFSKQFGTAMTFLGYNDLEAAFQAADARQAERDAAALTRSALRVVEPKPAEIRDGLRFYHGLAGLLERHQANAFTIDCFGGLLAKTLPAYPCIAWSKLNDEGRYGVCEGDLRSTMTQMLVTPCAGVPGFVTDPVFDTSRNEVIHAHCVSATRLKGFHAPPSPFILRSHLETAEGAVMQVLVPTNETVTVGVFATPKKFLVSTAEVTGNVDSDRGCRTQFRTRVADAQKMLEGWSSGLHRVAFFGDHVRGIERLGRLLGFEVAREG